jgi:hypothetical protein
MCWEESEGRFWLMQEVEGADVWAGRAQQPARGWVGGQADQGGGKWVRALMLTSGCKLEVTVRQQESVVRNSRADN